MRIVSWENQHSAKNEELQEIHEDIKDSEWKKNGKKINKWINGLEFRFKWGKKESGRNEIKKRWEEKNKKKDWKKSHTIFFSSLHTRRKTSKLGSGTRNQCKVDIAGR